MTHFENGSGTLRATAPMRLSGMELTFLHDLPGFKGARHFVVEPLGDTTTAVFASLRCTDGIQVKGSEPLTNLTLLVMSPGIFWREYQVHIDEAMVEELDLSQEDDAALLVIVHPKEPLSHSTANLYSPIVFNRRTGAADQLVPGVSEKEVGWGVRTVFPLDRED